MDSGLVPVDGVCSLCPKGNAVYEEYFTISTVPMRKCNHHATLDICSTTGKIASAKCPASGIVQKVFILGSDPKTIDKAYIATEEFLSTICNGHSPKPNTPNTDEPSTDKPGNDKPGNDNPDNNKPDNDKPDNETPGNDTPGNDTPGNDTPDDEKPDSQKTENGSNNTDNTNNNN